MTQSDTIEPKTPQKLSKAKKKKLMAEALNVNLGIVSMACRQVGISRDTHYRWLKEDPKYKKYLEDAHFNQKDFGEHALMKLVREGNASAVLFFNKTINKDRGYIEKQEIEHSTSGVKIEVSIPEEIKELFNKNN